MATLVLTNSGTAAVGLADVGGSLAAGSSVTITRPLAQIQMMKDVMAKVAAGTLKAVLTLDASDKAVIPNKVTSGLLVKDGTSASSQSTGAVAVTINVDYTAGLVALGGALYEIAAGTSVNNVVRVSAGVATDGAPTLGAGTGNDTVKCYAVAYKGTSAASVVVVAGAPAADATTAAYPTDAEILAACTVDNSATAVTEAVKLCAFTVARTADTTLAAITFNNTVRPLA